MRFLGNIIWFVFGLIGAIGWCIAGFVYCLTIIGIPFGIQCFKIASVQIAPFGKEIVNDPGIQPISVIGNILWILIFGWELALINALFGLVFCITIVGIPFGLQFFKMASISLSPFGKSIYYQ